MAVRNACVARGATSTAGLTTLYQVPLGKVFLPKFIGLQQLQGAAATYSLLLFPSAGAGNAILASGTMPASLWFNWTGWTAMNAGDTIQAVITGSTFNYWIAGAVLPSA